MATSRERINYGAKAELTAFKKNRIVTLLLFGFGGLLYGFGFPSFAGMMLYIIALFSLYTACSNVFGDMHDIPTADVQMSLPLNSTERYLSRLLSIFYIWALPFLISAAAGILFSLMFIGDGSRGWEADDLLEFNIQALLFYVHTALFIAAVTIISQCCVGSKAESKYMPILVYIVVNSLPMSFILTFQDKFADTSMNVYRQDLSLIAPVVYDMDFANVVKTVLWCAVLLAVIFCGVFLYKRRDARTVGRPIVFGIFFEIVAALTLLVLFCIAHSYGVSITTLFFAWLGSIILRIIVSRKEFKFQKILIWTGLYFVYYIAFLLFMFIAFKTGGFGVLYKTPDAEDFAYRKIEVTVGASHPMGTVYGRYAANNWSESDAEAVFEHIKAYAKYQKNIKGFFRYSMFERGRYYDYDEESFIDKNCSTCSFYIRTVDYSAISESQSYRIEFYIPQEYADSFYEPFRYDFGLIEESDSGGYGL